MFKLISVFAVAAAAATTLAAPTFAQEPSGQLGNVHFPTSCNEAAQRRFDRGMRYQHSFWYRQAEEVFEDVLKADPQCGIAYWGIALSLINNPFNQSVPPANLAMGLAAIKKGQEIGAKTERERGFIKALAAFYTDYDKIDHRSRVLAHFKAIEALAKQNPDDDETQIYYALALDFSASPADKTYANQLKAAQILEPIFARQPQHPGVAHYLIHTYDYPPIAHKGLDAALRYSKIAAAAPHAQHMPSHIFTRVGYWKESIASNIASVRAAKAGRETGEQFHANDYMIYGYLQLAQDERARQTLQDSVALAGNAEVAGANFGLNASMARYVVERGDWKAAAELAVRPTKVAQVEAITRFARALGATRLGNAGAAEADIARLAELSAILRDAKDAYWSGQVDIQHQITAAWALYAQGQHDAALNAMSAASDAEDKTEKAPVTPGPIVPARELYGAMLLERGLAKEALAAYEATLKKEPHRLGATIGAARAALKAGESAKAHLHYAAAVALAENADPVRAEVAEARAFVARAH